MRWTFFICLINFSLPAMSQVKGSLWDVKYINDVPSCTAKKSGSVTEIIYTALEYRGQPKKVFAYYSTPGMLSRDTKTDINLPAIILVHGGTGTAYSEWVKMWAAKGYAAFAMDLRGRDPSGKKIEGGFDETTSDMPVYKLYEPVSEQFLYQAVGDVIVAHNLLRSFKEVDASRIALCGISWGAVVSLITSGVDQRFRAVVPIYGSGYFPTSKLQALQGLSAAKKQVWIRQYDPKQYVSKATMPVLFVNGTNDNNFYLDSYAKTYALAKNKNLSIQIGMKHSHEDGFKIPEPYAFVNSYFKQEPPLALIGKPAVRRNKTVSKIRNNVPVARAYLNYTTDTAAILMDRKWQQSDAVVKRRKIITPRIPGSATMWFVSAQDKRGFITTAPIQFRHHSH